MNKINYKNDVRISRKLNNFRSEYTILELDFIYSFISIIDKDDVYLRNYSLSLAELELKMQRKLEIKKIEYLFDSLAKKAFKIDNEKGIEVYTFFTYLRYDKVEKILTVDFNYRLKEHLLQLKDFGTGNFRHPSQLIDN